MVLGNNKVIFSTEYLSYRNFDALNIDPSLLVNRSHNILYRNYIGKIRH